jgi:hypothetical protein
MALPAQDDFTDAGPTDLTTYSANWTAQQQMLRVSSNQLVPPSGGQDGIAYWGGDAFGDDHCSQVLVVNTSNYGGLVVRAGGTAGGANCVGYLWLYSLGLVYRINATGGSFTQIALGWSVPSAADTAKFVASGVNLVGYINGTQTNTTTDPLNAYPTGGAPGVYMSGFGAILDTWRGNNGSTIGSSGPTVGELVAARGIFPAQHLRSRAVIGY